MSSELEGLCKSLSSLGVDWNERMAAMQRVRDLVAVDTGATVEAYACLAKPLGVQFADLRSQIVKEAAVTMSALAVRFGASFSVMAAPLVAPAMRVLKSAKGVMFNASAAALADTVHHCQHPALLALLVEAAADKHQAIRQHAMRSVGQALQQWMSAEHSWATIEPALRRCVSDADVQVRAEARTTYSSYVVRNRDGALAFFATLEPSVQRKLEALNSAPKADVVSVSTALESVEPALLARREARDATPLRPSSEEVHLAHTQLPRMAAPVTIAAPETPIMSHEAVVCVESPHKPKHTLMDEVGSTNADVLQTPVVPHHTDAQQPPSPHKPSVLHQMSTVGEPEMTPVQQHKNVEEQATFIAPASKKGGARRVKANNSTNITTATTKENASMATTTTTTTIKGKAQFTPVAKRTRRSVKK